MSLVLFFPFMFYVYGVFCQHICCDVCTMHLVPMGAREGFPSPLQPPATGVSEGCEPLAAGNLGIEAGPLQVQSSYLLSHFPSS